MSITMSSEHLRYAAEVNLVDTNDDDQVARLVCRRCAPSARSGTQWWPRCSGGWSWGSGWSWVQLLGGGRDPERPRLAPDVAAGPKALTLWAHVGSAVPPEGAVEARAWTTVE